ncbi:proteasome assembly chaperone 4-like [Zootermopsis nevadensis]|uniref:Proteasome assembly chaperone 4 n=1 Tax=Zootermopsis nevadensis TaxID=136037 RepID=A0A067RA90_ZOONE|nr:proteasome assembly chaperone 4-like [Zootermopsis nevadensis]KDR20508.1 Proteasome assembly chaperone 4 [Zootermopsis nevadensis]
MDEHVPSSASSGTASIEFMKPNCEIHSFGTEVAATPVHFQVLKMENSLLIWIGSGTDPTFSDLGMALNTSYDRLPLCTRLMGAQSDMASLNLASRLTKKSQMAVYVSYNLPSDRLILPAIEKRLQEEIKAYPEKFGIV